MDTGRDLLRKWIVEVPLHRPHVHKADSLDPTSKPWLKNPWRDSIGVEVHQSRITPPKLRDRPNRATSPEQSRQPSPTAAEDSRQADATDGAVPRRPGRPVDMEARRAALRARLATARGALDQLDEGVDRGLVAASYGVGVARLLQFVRLLELSPAVMTLIEASSAPLPPERVLISLTVLDKAEQLAAIQTWVSEARRTGRWG